MKHHLAYSQKKKMVGVRRPLPRVILGSTGPRWSEMAYFEPITAHSASAVTPSETSPGSPLRAFQ